MRFDGVFRDAKIWINGHYLGDHELGYLSFDDDISELLNYGGKNVTVVRVDASQREGWWYEGAGTYRNAWLESVEAVVQGQERVAAKGHDGRLLLGTEHAGAGILRSGLAVLDPSTAATARLPFGDGFGVDAVAGSLVALGCSTCPIKHPSRLG